MLEFLTTTSHRARAFLYGSALAVALAPVACGGTSDTTPGDTVKISTIAEARALAPNTEATVEGFVTVAPGTFSSATSEQGFAIQDDTAGVYVSLPTKLDFSLDAKVRVVGRTGEMAKLLTLTSTAAEVSVQSGTKAITAQDVKTGDVNESIEGRLIRVAGKVTQTFIDDSPYGYKLYVDDGSGEVQVFVHVSAGVDAASLMTLMMGDSITVTGLTAQYETTYEVAPRGPADLILAQ
jgi:DNA/RNA endonuclease YhcR with UshA esterase domain